LERDGLDQFVSSLESVAGDDAATQADVVLGPDDGHRIPESEPTGPKAQAAWRAMKLIWTNGFVPAALSDQKIADAANELLRQMHGKKAPKVSPDTCAAVLGIQGKRRKRASRGA
jgi:hypothetical protein